MRRGATEGGRGSGNDRGGAKRRWKGRYDRGCGDDCILKRRDEEVGGFSFVYI